MNAWRDDVDTWMNSDTYSQYCRARNWRELRKSSFSAYLQHLSGCKFLLRRLIALPIVSPASSAAQPANDPSRREQLLHNFLQLSREWATHKQSEEHQAAIQRSRESDQDRLSIRFWQVQRAYKEAAKLSRMVKDGTRDFFRLSAWEQKIVEDYDCRRGLTKDLDALLTEHAARPAPYRCAMRC